MRGNIDIAHFLETEDIDVFSVAGIDNLAPSDRSDVLAFLPEAQSVIVLGRSIAPGVFSLSPRKKTRAMVRTGMDLDRVAHSLAGSSGESGPDPHSGL